MTKLNHLWAVSVVLAHLCSSSLTCPFENGATCPLEAYLKEHHPELAVDKFLIYCDLATADKWYSFLIQQAQEAISHLPNVEYVETE